MSVTMSHRSSSEPSCLRIAAEGAGGPMVGIVLVLGGCCWERLTTDYGRPSADGGLVVVDAERRLGGLACDRSWWSLFVDR